MSGFWEAGTSKVVLLCGRREHFAKTGRRGNGNESCPIFELKLLPKWSQYWSLGASWVKLCDFGGSFLDAVFA